MAEPAYFPCYDSYCERLAKLSDQEVGRLFRALMLYHKTGRRQELAGRESVAFDFIAVDIDRANEAYAQMCRRNGENGKKGGRPKKRPVSEKAPGFLETQKSQREGERERKRESPLSEGGRACAREAPPLAAACADFLARVDPSAPPQCLEELSVFAREMGDDVCGRAIDIALERKKAAWPYIRAILQDKRDKGVKSLADWEALDKKGARGRKGAAQDFRPDAARIQENNAWLDSFLAEQEGGQS